MYPSRRSHHRQSVTISMLLGQGYQICVETFRTLTDFLHIKITGLEGVSKFVGLHIRIHMVMWFCIAKCVAHRPINKQKLNRIHFCFNSLRKHLSQVSEYLILSRFLLGTISVSLGSLSVFACFTLGVRSVQSWFSLGSLLGFCVPCTNDPFFIHKYSMSHSVTWFNDSCLTFPKLRWLQIPSPPPHVGRAVV